MSGGSARSAKLEDAGAITGIAAACETWIPNVGSGAAPAVQALKQPAMLVVPSGQHGQGFESSGAGIESAQGMSAALVPTADAIAVAIGADSNSCAATSTYIRGRTIRRFTVPNIGLHA